MENKENIGYFKEYNPADETTGADFAERDEDESEKQTNKDMGKVAIDSTFHDYENKENDNEHKQNKFAFDIRGSLDADKRDKVINELYENGFQLCEAKKSIGQIGQWYDEAIYADFYKLYFTDNDIVLGLSCKKETFDKYNDKSKDDAVSIDIDDSLSRSPRGSMVPHFYFDKNPESSWKEIEYIKENNLTSKEGLYDFIKEHRELVELGNGKKAYFSEMPFYTDKLMDEISREMNSKNDQNNDYLTIITSTNLGYGDEVSEILTPYVKKAPWSSNGSVLFKDEGNKDKDYVMGRFIKDIKEKIEKQPDANLEDILKSYSSNPLEKR